MNVAAAAVQQLLAVLAVHCVNAAMTGYQLMAIRAATQLLPQLLLLLL